MIIGQCSAIPFSEDINCYHAHKIISEIEIEQIGFAESHMHMMVLSSNQEIISHIDNDEVIINDTAYNAAKKLVEYLLSQAKETIGNIKAIKKTSSVKGNCYHHGNEIGMITGQVRDGRKIGFSGLRLKDDMTLNSFLLFVNPEELLSNAYEQIDPDVYAKLAVLNNSTYLSVKSIIQKATNSSEKNESSLLLFTAISCLTIIVQESDLFIISPCVF